MSERETVEQAAETDWQLAERLERDYRLPRRHLPMGLVRHIQALDADSAALAQLKGASGCCVGCEDKAQENAELKAEREYRWTQLRITSNSGKTLFSCKCCGRISPTPDKTCNTQHDGWGAARQVDCSSWMPDVIPLAKHRQQAGEGGDG